MHTEIANSCEQYQKAKWSWNKWRGTGYVRFIWTSSVEKGVELVVMVVGGVEWLAQLVFD